MSKALKRIQKFLTVWEDYSDAKVIHVEHGENGEALDLTLGDLRKLVKQATPKMDQGITLVNLATGQRGFIPNGAIIQLPHCRNCGWAQ